MVPTKLFHRPGTGGRMLQDIPPFAFVIDTESYAGNFERQLCAFITGTTGECGIGEEEAQYFLKSQGLPKLHPFQNIIADVPDEHGCHRPVAIWPTPGWCNNGNGLEYRDSDPRASGVITKYPAYRSVAIFFSEEPSPEQIKIMRERALAYFDFSDHEKKMLRRHNRGDKIVTITGFRLLKLSLHEELKAAFSV